MYDIRQFRPTLYALLLLGYLGYSVAARTPGMWFIATAATLLHMYLVSRNAFRPLPRLAANLITLIFAGWLVLRVKQIPGPPILAIGEFLIFLQLVKLFEQRGNRDVAQLLILSLLLMVAAAISTGSLLFGLMFVAYLFLSLYCCLLFHLKTETDHARNVLGVDEKKLNPMTLKQDQRFLPRSMRRLTGFVSIVAILMAVFVFLFFPRGTGAGLIGNLAFRPSQAMTGFSDQISFQDVARITQNEAEVAYVTIDKDGEAFGGPGQPIYLRGSAPDTYVSDPNDADHWKWKRDRRSSLMIPMIGRGTERILNDQVSADAVYRQQIRLFPTGSNVLFAMPGIRSIAPGRDLRITYGAADDVIQLQDPLTGELGYTVYSSNAPTTRPTAISWSTLSLQGARSEPADSADPKYPVPPEIQKIALQDNVSGVDQRGNLGKQRLNKTNISELDETIAHNIEHYLQTNFQYTLDLTDTRRVEGKDPIVGFLQDFKKGHCEYFAGAMALLCQSLNMDARVVVGFKCDNFNTVGSYYTVRQSDAHAWVEVLTLNGWQTFDPTAGRQVATKASPNVWKKMMLFVDYLEYSWGNKVINFDSDSRNSLIQSVDNTLGNTASRSTDWMNSAQDWFNLTNFYNVSSGLLTALITGMVLVIAGASLYFLYERIRLRRRARRIGLDNLPSSDQKRLAKQLAFYDELLRALDRRNIPRPTHLTPMEFSRSMGFLPGDLYAAIQRLTRIFYRVRYGGRELDVHQQRRLMRVVERIAAAFGQAKGSV